MICEFCKKEICSHTKETIEGLVAKLELFEQVYKSIYQEHESLKKQYQNQKTYLLSILETK
jgi:hypothetical protein